MAVFTKTCTKTKDLGFGAVLEVGTWADLNSDATGTLTTEKQVAGNPTFAVGNILGWGFSSDGSNVVTATASTTAPDTIVITCTAADTGTYWLIGKGV